MPTGSDLIGTGKLFRPKISPLEICCVLRWSVKALGILRVSAVSVNTFGKEITLSSHQLGDLFQLSEGKALGNRMQKECRDAQMGKEPWSAGCLQGTTPEKYYWLQHFPKVWMSLYWGPLLRHWLLSLPHLFTVLQTVPLSHYLKRLCILIQQEASLSLFCPLCPFGLPSFCSIEKCWQADLFGF